MVRCIIQMNVKFPRWKRRAVILRERIVSLCHNRNQGCVVLKYHIDVAIGWQGDLFREGRLLGKVGENSSSLKGSWGRHGSDLRFEFIV